MTEVDKEVSCAAILSAPLPDPAHRPVPPEHAACRLKTEQEWRDVAVAELRRERTDG